MNKAEVILEALNKPNLDIHGIIAQALNLDRQSAKKINLTIFSRLLEIQDRDNILPIYDKMVEISLNKFPLQAGMAIYYFKEDSTEITSVMIGVGITLDEALELQKTVKLFKSEQDALVYKP